MAYEGNIAPVQVLEQLNSVHYDVKRALKVSQEEINTMISDIGDPSKKIIIINGQQMDKTSSTYTIQLSLAVNNRLEQLSTQSTTILSVFSELYKMEKSLGGTS